MKAYIILAMLQAATEFLPVSSSGHLALLTNFISKPDLFLFTALHLASLVAVIVFTRKEIAELFSFKEGSFAMWAKLAIATIPAAAFGFFFRKTILSAFQSLTSIGVAFIVTGIILFLTRFARRGSVLTTKNSFLIGLAQVLGLFPGISRSGITISTGLFLGLEPEKAARFSFLLFIPLGLGAFALESFEAWRLDAALLVAFVVCLILSLLFLKLLLVIIKKGRFWMFSFYCFILGALALFLSVTACSEIGESLQRADLPIKVGSSTWKVFEDVQEVSAIKLVFDPGRGRGKIPENISAQFACSPKTFDTYIVIYNKNIQEETLAHEALHAQTIVRGYPFLVNRAFPEKNTIANLENQIQHMRIFPEMKKMGFKPVEYSQKRWRSGIENIGPDYLKTIPEGIDPRIGKAIVATYVLGGLVAGVGPAEIAENIPEQYINSLSMGKAAYEALKRYDLQDKEENRRARVEVASLLDLTDKDAIICEMDFKNSEVSFYGIETGKKLEK